jgi:RimJ/RimL family protein N-acetyltransferase
MRKNDLGQPIGEPVPGWAPRPRPPRTPLEGRYCRLEPIDPARHGDALFEAFAQDREGRMWTYLGAEPFHDRQPFDAFLEGLAASEDPLFSTVIDAATGRALGYQGLMRIDPPNGVIEVGHVTYAPALQRTRVATEAQYLFMRRAFDELGYRRYEWKCDSLNMPSRAAAERLGFTFEGIFRQAVVYKGRNRDTAWFSILDAEWPARRQAFEAWLEPGNFDGEGRQRRRLEDLRTAAGLG